MVGERGARGGEQEGTQEGLGAEERDSLQRRPFRSMSCTGKERGDCGSRIATPVLVVIMHVGCATCKECTIARATRAAPSCTT